MQHCLREMVDLTETQSEQSESEMYPLEVSEQMGCFCFKRIARFARAVILETVRQDIVKSLMLLKKEQITPWSIFHFCWLLLDD